MNKQTDGYKNGKAWRRLSDLKALLGASSSGASSLQGCRAILRTCLPERPSAGGCSISVSASALVFFFYVFFWGTFPFHSPPWKCCSAFLCWSGFREKTPCWVWFRSDVDLGLFKTDNIKFGPLCVASPELMPRINSIVPLFLNSVNEKVPYILESLSILWNLLPRELLVSVACVLKHRGSKILDNLNQLNKLKWTIKLFLPL